MKEYDDKVGGKQSFSGTMKLYSKESVSDIDLSLSAGKVSYDMEIEKKMEILRCYRVLIRRL